jgi:hypothetical protein
MYEISRTRREPGTPQERLARESESWEMAVNRAIGLVCGKLGASILWYRIGELRGRSSRKFLPRLDGISRRDYLVGLVRSSVWQMGTRVYRRMKDGQWRVARRAGGQQEDAGGSKISSVISANRDKQLG